MPIVLEKKHNIAEHASYLLAVEVSSDMRS
jgi:hypothetical protein